MNQTFPKKVSLYAYNLDVAETDEDQIFHCRWSKVTA